MELTPIKSFEIRSGTKNIERNLWMNLWGIHWKMVENSQALTLLLKCLFREVNNDFNILINYARKFLWELWLIKSFSTKTTEKRASQKVSNAGVQVRLRLSDSLQAEQEIFSTSLTYHMVAKFVVPRLRSRNRFVLHLEIDCAISLRRHETTSNFSHGKTVSGGLSINNVKKKKTDFSESDRFSMAKANEIWRHF